MHTRFIAVLAVLFATSAFAQDPAAAPAAAPPPAPTADEINKVLDYQDNGKDVGPILLKIVPCTKVDSAKGPTQFTCIEPITGPVKKGTTVHAWVQFFCPKDGKYDDVTIQWQLDGSTRTTTDVSVSGLGRTRTWKASGLTKPGKWTIKVMRGDKELGSANVTVEA